MSFFVFLAAVIAAALSGMFFQPGEWYAALAKPSWTPPNWAFGPVWTALYLMIAVAGWLVWRKVGFSVPIAIWIAQLALNAMWSYLFFGVKRMDIAFVDVSLMWVTIAAFIVAAYPVSWIASALFVPYLVWVTIAAALNRAVWQMNPGI